MPTKLTPYRSTTGLALALLLWATIPDAWAAKPAAGTGHAVAKTDVSPDGEMKPADYPAGALAKGIGGKVVLRLLIATDGHVRKIKVVSSSPAGVFDEVSIGAASKWKFHPATSNGKAVAGWIKVPFEFEPDEDHRHGDRKSKATG